MTATQTIRYGTPGRRGRYRCADCRYEIGVGDVSSMPPCPRSGDLPHDAHAWKRRGHGLAWALAAGALGLGAVAASYALGTRRVAEEARRLAEEGRRFAAQGLHHAEQGVERARRSAHSLLS